MKLHEMIESIQTRDDLADFVDAMLTDLQTNPAEWENPTLDRFLEAMGAWVRAMPAAYENLGRSPCEMPEWRTIAEILHAAKVYE